MLSQIGQHALPSNLLIAKRYSFIVKYHRSLIDWLIMPTGRYFTGHSSTSVHGMLIAWQRFVSSPDWAKCPDRCNYQPVPVVDCLGNQITNLGPQPHSPWPVRPSRRPPQEAEKFNKTIYQKFIVALWCVLWFVSFAMLWMDDDDVDAVQICRDAILRYRQSIGSMISKRLGVSRQ